MQRFISIYKVYSLTDMLNEKKCVMKVFERESGSVSLNNILAFRT